MSSTHIVNQSDGGHGEFVDYVMKEVCDSIIMSSTHLIMSSVRQSSLHKLIEMVMYVIEEI